MPRYKCPICNGCIKVMGIANDGSLMWYCDFCIKWFKIHQGGVIEEIEHD